MGSPQGGCGGTSASFLLAARLGVSTPGHSVSYHYILWCSLGRPLLVVVSSVKTPLHMTLIVLVYAEASGVVALAIGDGTASALTSITAPDDTVGAIKPERCASARARAVRASS